MFQKFFTPTEENIYVRTLSSGRSLAGTENMWMLKGRWTMVFWPPSFPLRKANIIKEIP